MTADLAWLVGLELSLLRPEVRCNRASLDALLHPDFVEIGASGRRWTRAEMIDHLALTANDSDVEITDMSAREIARGVVLITFTTRSAHRRCLRTSVWVGAGRSWSIVHHQGTPSPPD